MANGEKNRNTKCDKKVLFGEDSKKISGGVKLSTDKTVLKRLNPAYGGPDFFRKRREEKKLRERLVDVIDTESGELIGEDVSSSDEVLDEDDAGGSLEERTTI